ncbi:MAG: ABC transporter substrate-binding protein, partial [Anaerolineae bacterium]|nr:ABC transporter substrate-binding protein [Anaerolineae bacterium]
MDREALVDRVFEGRNTPAYSMVPPSYPGATESFLDKYGTRDLDLSKKLLTEMGYTAENPFTFDLFYPPDHYGTTTVDVMQVLKQQLEETGLMKVNLQTQAWAQYIGESVPQGKFPAFILGWFPDFADPETWLTPFASCNQSPAQGISYCDEKFDELLAQARAESDPAKREELNKQIDTYWAENVPSLPLFWEPEYITAR